MNADDFLNACEPAVIWTWSINFVELLKLQSYFHCVHTQPFIWSFLWNICYLNRLSFLLFPTCPLGVFHVCWKRSTRLHSHPPSILPLLPPLSRPSQSCLFQLSSEPWVISVATRGRDMWGITFISLGKNDAGHNATLFAITNGCLPAVCKQEEQPDVSRVRHLG